MAVAQKMMPRIAPWSMKAKTKTCLRSPRSFILSHTQMDATSHQLKTTESQSKPGIDLVYPEPCKQVKRHLHPFLVGILPTSPQMRPKHGPKWVWKLPSSLAEWMAQKKSKLYIYHSNGPAPKSFKFMNSGGEHLSPTKNHAEPSRARMAELATTKTRLLSAPLLFFFFLLLAVYWKTQ